jgi:carboxypeptidase C (cathepsin A)
LRIGDRLALTTVSCRYTVVQLPFTDTAGRFLTDVQSSTNWVLRFRGDDSTITVEAHAMDLDGAVKVTGAR